MEGEAASAGRTMICERFFETAVDLLCIADCDGRIRHVNPAWERVLGWAPDEIVGRPYIDFVHPDDLAATAAAAEALERGETVLRFSNRYRAKSGDWRELEWCSVVKTEDGLIYATVRDITGERRAAARAAEVEAISGVGSWEIDLATGALYWSPTVVALHGLEPGAQPDVERALSFFTTEARALLEPALDRVSTDGTPYDLTLDFVTADGRRRLVRATGAADARDGRIARLYGTFQDVTDLKRAERRLADIIRGTNAGTWEWNVQTGETIFNERWAEIVGRTLEELGPTTIDTWMGFAHPDDLSKSGRLLEEHFAGRSEFYSCEARMRHRDGRWVWVLDQGRVASWTADGKPEWILGTHLDITAIKEQEAAMRAAREAADAANIAKSRFLANMSHEIRTPMNGVLGMAEVLDAALTEPAHKRMLGVIRESGRHLLELINDILDLSKIEAGRLEFDPAPFRPEDFARKLEAAYTLKAAEKGLSFAVLTTKDADVARIGDEGRVMQIAHNLVSNAIKFTAEGRVTVSLDCRASRPFEITVADTGIGMSAEQVDRVFDDFAQADASTTRLYGGTGLGMGIVKRLVDLMDGRVEVRSQPGLGTTTVIALPLEAADGAADGAATGAAVAEPDAAPLPALRLLAAEDNEVNRIVLGALLARLGQEVEFVENGAEAVEACREGAYDALLLDISMPVMDGTEALRRIRAAGDAATRAAPAIAVTANALAHQVEEYRREGFAAHVPKPIDSAALESALRIVAGSRLSDGVAAQ